MTNLLSVEELKIINALGDVWNSFVELAVVHSSDTSEFRQAIHKAQRIVMTRPVTRQLKGFESHG